MKKLLFIFILFLPVYVFAGTYDDMAKELISKIPAKDKTKVLAVMPFSADKEFSSEAGLATEEMTKALINAGATVSERSQIDKILKEQELQQVGLLTNQDAGEVGQGLGAKYVILGSVTKIDKFGEQGNIGLKINVKLVVSANYKVLAASSIDVAAGDASSRYKRKEPRKAAEYPQFLEVFGGPTFLKYSGKYDDNKVKDERHTGFSAGARYIHESKGFFTSGWEFLFSTRKFDEDTTYKRFEVYQLSWIPTIRIPLWAYFDSLPDYTSLSFAYAFGLGIDRMKYIDNNETKYSRGFGVCSSPIIGLKIGLSDSVAFFVDGRYFPHRLNNFLRYPGNNIDVKEDTIGPAAYFGISLMP